MAAITTTDLPEGMASAIRYADTPVTDLVAGQTFRQVRMGREERHLSVVGVRRVNGTHDYMVVSYLHDGRQGEIHLRVGTTVEVGRVRQSPSADAGLSDRRGRAAVGAAALLVAAGVLVVPAPASDAAAVYRQIACAPGGEVVSQNFGSPTGGASRIDGPLGGTGWQCRTYTTSFTGYMRLASRRVGVPLKCEVWRGDLRMVWDERPTAVGCYVLPSQGSRS